MKNFLAFILVLAIICGGTVYTVEKKAEETEINLVPQKSEMKNICELAVFKCFYHNVARFHEEDAIGMLLWKRDMDFWIEYEGVVTVGIDGSLVDFDISGDSVTIYIPEPKVLSVDMNSSKLDENSFISAEKIEYSSADDATLAINIAQENMKETASNDATMLSAAQERVKLLLGDYVTGIGNAMGISYTIVWEYI